jgi:hypothetical protein
MTIFLGVIIFQLLVGVFELANVICRQDHKFFSGRPVILLSAMLQRLTMPAIKHHLATTQQKYRSAKCNS